MQNAEWEEERGLGSRQMAEKAGFLKLITANCYLPTNLLPAGDKTDDAQFVVIEFCKGRYCVINILFGGGSAQGKAHRAVGLVLTEAQGQEGMGRVGIA